MADCDIDLYADVDEDGDFADRSSSVVDDKSGDLYDEILVLKLF